MNEVGRRYDAGECPLPLVLRSADCARAAFGSLRSLRPAAAGARGDTAGAVIVLATVRGDLHDIGKNLVGMVLESAGYEVADLGTDVDAPRIVAAARQCR
jgi:5-methyltetrahydrofolate--homocysteine methyltransferase